MNSGVVTQLQRKEFLREIYSRDSIIDQLRKELDQLKKRSKRKDERIAFLEKVARMDPMTGVHNRRSLVGIYRREVNRAKRTGRAFSLAVVDLDLFKNINDTYGHLVGDMVITTFAELIEREVRNTDWVIRYGGEEFVVVLSDCSLEKAKKFFERFRKKMQKKLCIKVGSETLRPTASFGVTEWHPEVKTMKALIERADHALYEAKHGGRDQVRVA